MSVFVPEREEPTRNKERKKEKEKKNKKEKRKKIRGTKDDKR